MHLIFPAKDIQFNPHKGFEGKDAEGLCLFPLADSR